MELEHEAHTQPSLAVSDSMRGTRMQGGGSLMGHPQTPPCRRYDTVSLKALGTPRWGRSGTDLDSSSKY